jgi:hypothetical protein
MKRLAVGATATALCTLLLVSVATAQSGLDGWRISDIQDTFGRVTKRIGLDGQSNVHDRGGSRAAAANLYVRADFAYIVTGDPHICHSEYNPARVQIQADGGRIIDTRASDVSGDSTALRLNNTALQAILSARSSIRVETQDFCGSIVSINFSSMDLEHVIRHVRPNYRAPANRQR